MNCWICGADANSGEHLIKASDLRAIFGVGITQKSPLYFHDSVRRNVEVGGIKSDKLKYKARLCAHCNNQRTQPHDRAWEKLSEYLQRRNPAIRAGTNVRLDAAFPGSVKESMLGVHLFFLKHFGCLIVENDIPLDIKQFSDAILNQTSHPEVYLAFWSGRDKPDRRQVGRTPVQTAALGGQIVFATWLYILDRITVNVMYCVPGDHRKGLAHAWHPSTIGKRIRIVGV